MTIVQKSINVSPNVLVQTIDDEVIILNTKTEKYFGLDAVAKDMWNLLEKHKNTKGVIEEMLRTYEVDEQTLSQDLDDLIKKLSQAGLILQS